MEEIASYTGHRVHACAVFRETAQPFQGAVSLLEPRPRLRWLSPHSFGPVVSGDEVCNPSEFNRLEPAAALLLLRNEFLDEKQCCEEDHEGGKMCPYEQDVKPSPAVSRSEGHAPPSQWEGSSVTKLPGPPWKSVPHRRLMLPCVLAS